MSLADAIARYAPLVLLTAFIVGGFFVDRGPSGGKGSGRRRFKR